MSASSAGRARVSWLLGAVSVLPALVVVVVALVQGSDLSLAKPTAELHRRAALEQSARSDALGAAGIGVVVLLALGCGLAWMLARQLRAARRLGSSGRSVPIAAPMDAVARTAETAAHDRDVLVAVCVELGDLVTSDSLRRRLRTALGQAGVQAVEVDEGIAFDADSYRVVDRVVTEDPRLHNRVASTERPGYVDRGRRLRVPEVLVYQRDGDTGV